jgi:hypothetical protein
MSHLRILLFLSAVWTTAGSWDDYGARDVDGDPSQGAQEFLRRGSSAHTDNWAVLVCTSRFWFNYRYVMLVHLWWCIYGINARSIRVCIHVLAYSSCLHVALLVQL